MALLIVDVCTVPFQAYKARDMQFFLQNEKYNIKCTRAACWINSEISNGDKNTTLLYFVSIVRHYYDVII